MADLFERAAERARRRSRTPAKATDRAATYQDAVAAWRDGGEHYDISRDPLAHVASTAIVMVDEAGQDAREGDDDMAKDSKVIKNVPVRYGKIGEVDGGGFKVPITVNASEVSFTEVRNTLISAECDVVLTCDPEGKNDDPKQSKMIETDLKVTAAGKIGRVSVSHENFRFALRCDIDDVDLNEIAKFGNRTGKATFRKTGNAADVARTESDDVEGEGALVQADKERS